MKAKALASVIACVFVAHASHDISWFGAIDRIIQFSMAYFVFYIFVFKEQP